MKTIILLIVLASLVFGVYEYTHPNEQLNEITITPSDNVQFGVYGYDVSVIHDIRCNSEYTFYHTGAYSYDSNCLVNISFDNNTLVIIETYVLNGVLSPESSDM